jgi:multiple sugar transport system permease protein
MLAPCLIVLLGFAVFPLLYSIILSLFSWDLQVPQVQFTGLGNYVDLLQDSEFVYSLGLTAVIVGSAVTIEAILGLSLALLLVGRLRGRRIFVALLTLPVAVAPVVVAYTWRLMFDAQFGPVNQFISWFAQQDVVFTWLNRVDTSIVAIVVADVWQWTPFMFLVLLAGLAALPQDLFEAAAVDGARPWQIFSRLTLPLIAPVLTVALLVRTLDGIKMFDIVFAMTRGGPGTATQTTSLYLYRTGFEYFRMGYTAAGTYVLVIIISVLVAIFLARTRSSQEEARA